MAARTLLVEVITPERLVYAFEVDMVVAPTISGEVGILPLHVPYVAALAPGVLRAKIGEEEEAIAIGSGYIEVKEDRVSVLADTAEEAGSIDIERAREVLAAAEAELAALSEGQAGFDQAKAALAKAAARVRAAELAARVARRAPDRGRGRAHRRPNGNQRDDRRRYQQRQRD